MNHLDRIVNLYQKEENDFIREESQESVKLAALYMFYHYYNADTTKLDELNSHFCFLSADFTDIIAINDNYYQSNTIDFIMALTSKKIKDLLNSNITESFQPYLEMINKVAANAICHNTNETNEEIISKLNEFDIDDNTSFNIIILCNSLLDMEKKLLLQKMAAEYKVKNDSIQIQLVFNDDLSEEISDVESPKDSVEQGELVLFCDNVCYFGQEKSFLGFISAKSLQNNYYLYSTHGLFASNLRYYVKSAKIDSQINNTIEHESENFCYFNNGIIITCEDYTIKDKTLSLRNYSIVNGGQTTNLIGRASFQDDFPVMCKVIKNKYHVIDEKVTFLSKVAEASNTQKPIKAKDLIANRIEQRLLKLQFEKAKIFLQVKRGEKIPKDIYNQPWQNATNDQIAQMLYACVYQNPGIAKNSKSKLLENEKIYKKLFQKTYSSEFFVSLQHIKVSYNNWVKKVKKEEKHGSSKLGLAKNCDLFNLAVIGLIYKMQSNIELRSFIEAIKTADVNNTNDNLKFVLSQNDIGTLSFLNPDVIMKIGEKTLFDLFENVFQKILIPAYDKFKKNYPTYSYSNFVKSDLYYYNFVVASTIKYLKTNPVSYNSFFDLSQTPQIIISKDDAFEEYKPGLEDELREYRTRTSKDLNVPAYEIFKNMQLSLILKLKPKTNDELRSLVKLTKTQCENYGEAICKIVRKYTCIDNYLNSQGQ